MGRPKKYATAAERQAAYRQRHADAYVSVEIELDATTAETLRKIAEFADMPQREIGAQILKIGLTNFPWLSGVALPFKRRLRNNPDGPKK